MEKLSVYSTIVGARVAAAVIAANVEISKSNVGDTNIL